MLVVIVYIFLIIRFEKSSFNIVKIKFLILKTPFSMFLKAKFI